MIKLDHTNLFEMCLLDFTQEIEPYLPIVRHKTMKSLSTYFVYDGYNIYIFATETFMMLKCIYCLNK